MPVRIIKDGQDPLTRPILEYLAITYGIPAAHIRNVRLESPYGAPQFLTVTLLVQAEEQKPWCDTSGCSLRMHDGPHRPHAVLGLAEPDLMANQVTLTFAGQGPTGDGDRDLADTAILPMPESHAPTTCVWPGQDVSNCGELIRWTEANGWHHVSDRELGQSAHPATPGPVAPPRLTRTNEG